MGRRKKVVPRQRNVRGGGWLEWRNGQWLARYVRNGKKLSKMTGTADKAVAEKMLQELSLENRLSDEKRELERIGRIRQIDAQMAEIDEKKHEIALADVYTAFEGSHNRKSCGAGELKQYKCYVTRFVAWMAEKFPDVRVMRQVSADHVERFADALAKDKTPATFNRHILLLKSVWKVLRKTGRLAENPWEDIQKKDAVSQTRRELTVEELVKVSNKTDGEMRILFALGIYTGQRLGDCARLQWGNVDLVRGIISLMPSKTKRHAQKRVVIPIHQTLFGLLNETPPSRRKGYVVPEIAALYQRDAAALSNRISEVFHACDIETTVKEEGKRAKVVVGFHSLRHTFVSLTANSGASLANVRSMTGHATTDMALHYFHENEAGLKRTIAMLPVIGGDASASVKPAVGEFDAFLNGLDLAALKRLKKAVEARLAKLK